MGPVKSEHSDSGKLDTSADGKKVGKWTPEEDDLLRKFVPMYGEKQWRKIAEHIPGRSSIQCLHRWTKILKPGLVKGPWTSEEDQKLMQWVKTEGPTKWAQAANYIKGRSGKQCRERWFNNLNPGVKKGNWAKEEDELIFELYQKYGSSWSKIAKFIPGRTENAIKNRFYSTLRKLAADKRKVKGENMSESVKAESIEEETIKNPEVPQTPNALYKLLQDKTVDAKKKSISIKNEEVEAEKAQQSFNINGEKFVVLRDSKIPERTIQDAAAKLVNAEIEDNDAAFERFLLNLDSNIKDDFISNEFENGKEQDDVSQFDQLQEKILSFCKNNVRDLTEAFKTVTNNRVDLPDEQKIRNSDPRPMINNIVEIPNTEIPKKKTTQKKESQSLNPIQNQILTPIQKLPVPEPSSRPPHLNLLDFGSSDTQTRPNLTANLNNLLKNMGGGLGSMAGIHQPYINNLVDMIQNIPQDNGLETEKRMTFLFQQLYSLESLLTNTRNELMKLENSMKTDLKVEDINDGLRHIMTSDQFVGGNYYNMNSEFDNMTKKKKNDSN